MSGIHVTSHGLRYDHPASFVVDRPYGLGCFLLLRFHSQMQVLTAQGLRFAEPGQCILFSPEQPQWYGYRWREGEWIDDWMHIDAEGQGASNEVAILAARYKVPLDTILAPYDTYFLPRIFDEITNEKQQAEANWEDAVELQVRQLILKLGRSLHDPVAQLSPAEAAHLPALRLLRRHVHEQLTKRWTVSEMAAEVGLSASRFAALYQQLFGVSPVEDLLRARIQHAEYLLTNRAMSVGQAASECGFQSVHYFTHVFHQRVGCAPRDYHRRDKQ